MSNEGLHSKIQEIKRGFRLVMNGEASRSMRDKGMDYRLNWGVSLADLRDMATEYGKDYDLAAALWKEDIRECKILATLIMPADRMSADLAELWMEQTTTQEIAEMTAFNLFQYIADASTVAFRWIAGDEDLRQICGYHILSRLFMRGCRPDERDADEFIDQVTTAMQSPSLSLRHAATTCRNRYEELNCSFHDNTSKEKDP